MILKRVAVSGANGFIGTHLCRQLVSAGKEVTACIRAQADATVLATIPGLKRIYSIPTTGGDSALCDLLSNSDAVIHLAGRAHIMRDPARKPLDEFRRVNVRGTEWWARLAAERGVKRFVYLSSIKVNGDTTGDKPFAADDPPGYTDAYGQSKWEAEERLRQIAGETTMQWVIVRPPLVYGPGVRGNFHTLLQFIYRRWPLPLASVDNCRSLVSVFNLSDFLCVLLDHPAAANHRFLVSDQDDLSTPELLRHIAEAFRCRSYLLPCPESVLRWTAGMAGRRTWAERVCSSLRVSTRKAEDHLGWRAPTTLSWELNRTAQWFLEQTK